MTIVIVVLIGGGVLLVASALDNTPIADTFRKIINNQPIDWSGSGQTSTLKNPKSSNPPTTTV